MKLLGIDVGTGGSRALVIDDAGRITSSATVEHVPFASPQTGWAEQDARDWWRASTLAIRDVLSKENPEEIGAIGLSGQMHGLVLLDKNDKVLRPSIIWCDQRTDVQCGSLTKEIGAERLIKLTCNPALTGFTLPKMLWVRECEPQLWQQVHAVLLPKDYVRLRLSGDKATDVADASGTLLFDVAQRKWSEEMLSATEIDWRLLPRVYESPHVTGIVSPAGAEATGLRAGTLIVAGGGDQAAGAVGMGIVRSGTVSATIGTSGVVFAASDKPALDPKGRVHTFTPHLDPHARAALVGLTASHARAHVVRAILEGVAFSLRDTFEIFEEMNVPVEQVRLGGGGARSRLWRQIQADIYGREVKTVAAEEGAAYGAALLAGVAAGAWPSVDAACDAVVRIASTIEPDAKSAIILDCQYQKFTKIYPALRSFQY